MSKLEFVEQHQEILIPGESLIAQFYREGRIEHDHDVIRVVDSLHAYYRAIVTNFPLPPPKLTSQNELALYEKLIENWKVHDSKKVFECIKVLKKSVSMWNRELGSQGYLGFISRFI
jgi:hypothetical protein